MLNFLANNRPPVTVMIQSKTAENAINTIRTAIYEVLMLLDFKFAELNRKKEKD